MAFTVTATQSGSSANRGVFLKVLVVTGATEAGGTTAGSNSASGVVASGSLTPTFSGSLVVFSVCEDGVGGGLNAAASNNTYDYSVGDGTDAWSSAQGHYTGTVTASTPLTYGEGTFASGDHSNWCAYEIPQTAGWAIDASSPAGANTLTLTAVTTASFTPPPGSVLAALVTPGGSASGTGITVTMTDTSGLGLVWTRRAISSTSDNFQPCFVFTATVPAAAGGAAPQAQPGQTWLRRFHHRQAPGWPPGPVAAAAAVPVEQVFPLPRRAAAPGRARLGRAAACAAGILAATTLSPQPAAVPPARPGPVIAHPAPHRVIWRGNAETAPPPFLTAKLPPTAVSPRPPHRAVTRWILAKTSLSPQPSAVPPPAWRQPNAPRPAHRAIWRVAGAPPPAVITVTAVPPERPQPVTNRPPAPHRAIGKGILAATTLSPQPSRVPPPQWRQPNAPRPAHRAVWRAIAGPAPAVVAVTGVPPARPGPVTNRPPPPHRATGKGVLAKTTLSPQPSSVPPSRPQPVTNRPPAPHRAIWDAIAGLPPVTAKAVPSRPQPVTNRPPAPHRALVRIVAAKTTLSAQPARVPGPQWRQPFAPRPAHRATWRRVAGPAPPPPPFTIGALTAASAATGQGAPQTGSSALTTAAAATGTQAPADKPAGAGAASTAPLGSTTATDI